MPDATPHTQILTKILAALDSEQFAPLRDRMLIFGSMGRGVARPGDIDLMIDLRDIPPSRFDAKHPLGNLAYRILNLSRHYYGYLDPFCMTAYNKATYGTGQTVLFCRNDHATGFIPAVRKSILWKDSQRDGRRVADVRAAWSGSTLPTSPALPPDPDSTNPDLGKQPRHPRFR
jgi:hypothetical protein